MINKEAEVKVFGNIVDPIKRVRKKRNYKQNRNTFTRQMSSWVTPGEFVYLQHFKKKHSLTTRMLILAGHRKIQDDYQAKLEKNRVMISADKYVEESLD